MECKAGFLECNPHKDRACDHRHSQLELLFLCVECKAGFLECNPHKDRACDDRHSQLEVQYLWLRLARSVIVSRIMWWRLHIQLFFENKIAFFQKRIL